MNPLQHVFQLIESAIIRQRFIFVGTAITLVLGRLYAGPDPVQHFYLPLPETDIRTTLVDLQPGRTIGQQMRSVTSLTTTRDNTIIYYDQWENGYDVDIANPTNIYSASNLGGTQIWGDGDPNNGIPPGFVTDVVDADAVIALISDVTLPRNPSTIYFDARDRVASTKAVAMTRAEWADNPGTVLAGAIEVYSEEFMGTVYEFPIGEDISASSMFDYVAVFVMATEDGTTVDIDIDGDGGVDITRILNQGENYFGTGVQSGGTVTASANVQVHLITGNKSTASGRLEARWFSMLPTATWSNEYYNPVGSSGTNQPSRVFLYNPNGAAITLDYETSVSSGNFVVGAGAVYEFTMPSNSGAVFISQGGENFFGIVNVAAGTSNGGSSSVDNDTWDWGFSLVPKEILTPQVVVGWGPGANDADQNGVPDGQGSPVWVAVTEDALVYIDYDGDASTGPFVDPNGNQYDTVLNLQRFQQAKIYDNNDNDQTGMKLYTVDGVLLTAAWGQDPSVAGVGNPFLDLGTSVPPFPFPQVIKTATEVPGLDGDGQFEPLDTVEYTITTKNLGAIPLSDLDLTDDLPPDVTYVPDSLVVGGVPYPDDLAGTPFPLDGDGIVLPLIDVRSELAVTFRVTIDTNALGGLTNTAFVNIGPELLIAASLSSSSLIEVINNRVAPGIEFTLSDGTVVGQGATPNYAEGDDVYVTLEDADFNINTSLVDSFTVVVQNTTNGDFETLLLTETGPNTGIFRNTSALAGSPNLGGNTQDGTLKYEAGETLYVEVTDSGDPTSSNFDSDTLIVVAPTNGKKLYLSDNGAPNLTRTEPGVGSPEQSQLSGGVQWDGSEYTTIINNQTGNYTVTVPSSGTLTVNGSLANRLMLISIFFEDDQNYSPSYDVANSTNAVRYHGPTTTVNATKLVEQISSEEAEVEMWYVLNPEAGSGTVEVDMINAQILSGGFEDSVIVTVTVFSDVDQATPFDAPDNFGSTDSNDTTTGINAIPADPGNLVFGLLSVDDAETITSAAGQTDIFGPTMSEFGVGDGSRGVISTKRASSGQSSVDFSWNFGGPDAWAVVGAAINNVGTNVLSITQDPVMDTDFTMPAGGTANITVYVETAGTLGSVSDEIEVEASLLNDGTPFFTDTLATITSISVGTGPNSNDVYELSWSGTLAADTTVSAGDAIGIDIINNGSVTFTVLYNTSTYKSCISLPASTVVSVENIEFYDAPYPGGNLITSGFVGQAIYVRTTISDPFGVSDITGETLRVLDPSDTEIESEVLDGGEEIVALATAFSNTYEYLWNTFSVGGIEGTYSIEVSADEGTEGTVSDLLIETFPLTGSDSGTPAFIEFTTGDNGPATDTYTAAESICVRLTDFDENENPGVAESVSVTITTSQGDSDVVTLTETNVDTGVFTACFPSAMDTANGDDGDINAPVGTSLNVNYVDNDDSFDVANDQGTVPLTAPNTPLVSVNKIIIEPSDGSVLLGENVIYQASVSNVGSVTLTSVELVDTFTDTELSFVSASIAPDSTSPSGTLTWNDLGTLNVGESTTVTLTFTTLAAGSIDNDADVDAGSAFGNVLDSDTVSLTVTNPALTITKTLDGGARTLFYGELLTYSIAIQNTGDTNIATLPFTDNYSTVLEFVAATPVPDGAGGGVLLWNDLGALATTATTNVSITFRVVGEANPTLNTAEVLFATDVNGDPVPSANDQNTELITDAASVSDLVWEDTDGNGSYTGGEPLLNNVRVYLDLNNNGIRDANEKFDDTDSNGNYKIGNLADGTYVVRIDESTLDSSLVNTTPATAAYTVVLGQGEDDDTIDFGVQRTIVEGFLFRDTNGDGLYDEDGLDNTLGTADDEIDLAGVDVFITDVNGDVQTVRTDVDGVFSAEVPPGLTWANVDENTLPANFALTTGNEPQSITAAPGTNNYTDIGYLSPQGVSGHLFIDTDGSTAQNGSEPDLEGVTVWADYVADGIFDADGADNIPGNNDDEIAVVTDENGDYQIQVDDLFIGSVSIQVDQTTLPSGLNTTPTTGNDPQNVTVLADVLVSAADVGYSFNALGILKVSDAGADVEPNDTLEYTITVANNSGTSQTGIDITDTLPADTSFVSGSLEIDAPASYIEATTIDETFPTAGDPTTGSPISSGSDIGWDSDWVKIDETANPGFSAGQTRIMDDPGIGGTQIVLRIQGDGDVANAGGGAIRAVNLADAVSATIAFNYRREDTDGEEVYIDLSNDNGATWPLRLITIPGLFGSDGSYQTQTATTIPSAYLTNNTQIRFISEDTFDSGGADRVYIDDITIALDELIPQTGTPGNFPTNDEIGNDYRLGDGQSITITYQVTVDAAPVGASIDNTATIVSNEQPGPVNSSTSDPIVTPPATGSLSGTVLADTDSDGVGNQPIVGVLIELLDAGGASIDSDSVVPGVQPTVTTTDANGDYSFTGLTPGNYQIKETQPSNYLSVAAADDGGDVNILGDNSTITVVADTDTSGNHFVEEEPSSVSGFVFEDFDLNGTGDIPISGVTIELLNGLGQSIDSDPITPGVQPTITTTDFTGEYFFDNLTPGTNVQVRQIQPSGYNSVSDSDGGNPNHIGNITPITLVAGVGNSGNNFIESIIPGSIAGTVEDDTTGDGNGDAALAGVTVVLDVNRNGVYDPAFDQTTTTNGSGVYSFSNLRPGIYDILETDPVGYVSVSDTDGGDKNTTTITLLAGENRTAVDFVDGLPATINGTVVNDLNSNGNDDSEPGLDGVTVELYLDLNSNGIFDFGETLIDTQVTAGGGLYSFTGVVADDYVIVETDLAGFFSTADVVGSNDNNIGITALPNTTHNGNDFLDVNAGPNVQVTKTLNGGAQTAYYNESVTYTIDVENIGNTNLTSVPLEDTYDDTVLEYVTADVIPDTVVAGTITWNDIGAINVGNTTSVAITFRVLTEANPTTNTATVDGAVDEFSTTLPLETDDDILLTTEVASISGKVWQDDDGDGTLNGAEAGFNGIVLVYLDLDSNSTRGVNEPTATVDSNGDYTIDNLAAGTYEVLVDESTLPSATSFVSTFPLVLPHTVVLTDGQDLVNQDFGYEPQVGALSIAKVAVPAGTVDPGDTITYTITVTNNDSVTHTGINVTDPLPNGTTIAGPITIVAPPTYTSGTTDTDIMDNWETSDYDGGTPDSTGGPTGTLGWEDAGWTELRESNGPGSGNVQVVTDLGDESLRIERNRYGVLRGINLGQLTASDSATLSFEWRSENLDTANDDVRIQIRPGTSGSWTTLQTIGNGQNHATYQSVTGLGISSTFFTSTAQVRIRSTNNLNNNDFIYVDNFVITATQTVTSPQPGVQGPLPAVATNYALDPGASMTISFPVTVNFTYPDISQVQNTATLVSTQQPGPIVANVFNPVDVGAVSGTVLEDLNGDGIGDVGIAGVTMELLDEFGNSIDGDFGTPGVQPVITTTAADGEYTFDNVPVGNYQVLQTQPGGYTSISDTDGSNDLVNNTIGDESPIVVTSGVDDNDNLFVEARTGAIEGSVVDDVNANGVNDSESGVGSGITIDLYVDLNGNGVLEGGDFLVATTTTNGSGFYQFLSVPIGNYIVQETDPATHFSTGDVDAPNNNLIGVTVTDGAVNSNNDFMDAGLTDNPDSDCYTVFLEYALVGDVTSGVIPSTWNDIVLVDASSGRIDARFTRPDDTYNISYTLEGQDSLLGAWFTIGTISANQAAPAPFSTLDNGDGTETITYGNVQNDPGFSSADFGLIRISVQYTGAASQTTDTFGWEKTTMTLDECNSWSDPFTPSEVFCGIVDGVAGDVLDLSTPSNGTDFSALLVGGNYYIEVLNGAFEGTRMDIASGGIDSVTLVNDADLYSPTPVDSFNTVTGIPALTGSTIAIKRFRTFGEMFDKTDTFLNQESGDPNNATHIFIYNNRLDTPIYESYVLTDIQEPFATFFGLTPGAYWVRENDLANPTDQGSRDIDPCTGFLMIPKQNVPVMYSFGKVRGHDASCVLNDGYNLVGAMYPLDQVPLDGDADGDGRGMSSPPFVGGTDPSTAAEIVLWHLDPEVGISDSTVFMLLDDGIRLHWSDFADPAFPNLDLDDDPANLLLQSNRASFIKLLSGDKFTHTLPEPGP